MDVGMVGLGRMGGNMARRLLRGGHRVVVFDRDPESVSALVRDGAVGAGSLAEMVTLLPAPRVVWMMVPAGAPVDDTIAELVPLLSAGDVLVDGGNSDFRDTMRRAGELAAQRLAFLDAGTSGGIWGLENGYCLMVGGPAEAFARVEPALAALAEPGGYLHVGPSGAGHFTKMVHNGIEYGMLQAYAEGFEILKRCGFPVDLRAVAALWNHGSVIRSWLLELAEAAFAGDPDLATVKGYVEDSGEGRWTVREAIALDVPAPVITASLFARFASRQEESFGAKVIAALRREFGGHAVKPE